MDNRFEIRQLKLTELDEALALVWRVFLAFEAPDYSTEGVREFKQFIDPVSIREKLAAGQFQMWTCTDAGRVVGVLAVRPVCHISLLFVDAAYQRQGIARALVETLVEQAKPIHTEITVNASPYAVEIYHRLGFTDTGAAQTVNGIRFTPMRVAMRSAESPNRQVD